MSESPVGAGPNRWGLDPDNVRFSPDGPISLHLTRVQQQWSCAEIATPLAFGDKRIVVELEGPLGELEQNVVFGAFVYHDDLHEFDFEIARWGVGPPASAQFVVSPPLGKRSVDAFTLPGRVGSVQLAIAWRGQDIDFGLRHGDGTIREASFRGGPDARDTSRAYALHFNLWLHGGRSPRGKPQSPQGVGRPDLQTVKISKVRVYGL